MNRPDSKYVKGLIVWYGLYQLIHIGVNLRGLFQLARGGIDFPALPPPEGWTPQVIHFFTGMASLDLLNAILTLVNEYFRLIHHPTHVRVVGADVQMASAQLPGG